MAGNTIVFITGANTGIGYEAAKALYSSPRAYTILLGGRSFEKAKAAIESLQKDVATGASRLEPLQIDIADDNSIASAFEVVSSRHQKVDTLVNNAGAAFDQDIGSASLTIREVWNKSWDVNVSGTHVLTHTFAPLLLKSSDPRLLFVTSGASTLAETTDLQNRLSASPGPGWPKSGRGAQASSYRSAKTGLNMLMREWSRLLRDDGVKVWAISPGLLATNLVGDSEALRKIGAGHPSVGGNFIKDVIQGERDLDVGKVIRKDSIQLW